MKIYNGYNAANTYYINDTNSISVDDLIAFLEPHRGKIFMNTAAEDLSFKIDSETVRCDESRYWSEIGEYNDAIDDRGATAKMTVTGNGNSLKNLHDMICSNIPAEKDYTIEFRLSENEHIYYITGNYFDEVKRVEALAARFTDLTFELSCADNDDWFVAADVFQNGEHTYSMLADYRMDDSPEIADDGWNITDDKYPIVQDGIFDAVIGKNQDGEHSDFAYREYKDGHIVVAMDGKFTGKPLGIYHFPYTLVL